MSTGAGKMAHASDPLTSPLKDFRAASHDLSAFGALGALLKATGQIREGMTQLSGIVVSLGEEYDAEGKAMQDVAKVFDEVDTALTHSLSTRRG